MHSFIHASTLPVLPFTGSFLSSLLSLSFFCVSLHLSFSPSCCLQYPCDSSGPDWSRLLAKEAQVEVFCENLEVQPEVVPPETPPLPALPDSPWHRHQGSDSGMYSIEQGSGQPGRASEQTSGALGSLGGASGSLGGTLGPLGGASGSLGGASGWSDWMALGHTGVATALMNSAESGQDSGIGRMVAV